MRRRRLRAAAAPLCGAVLTAAAPTAVATAAPAPPASWTISTVAAPFAYPDALAADGAGNVYVADAGAGAVYVVAPGGATSAVAARLADPRGVAVDGRGDVFVADTGHDRVVEVAAGATAPTTVAGNGTWGFTPDGASAAGAALEGPDGVAVDGAGDVFFSEGAANRIRRVDAVTGALLTVGGTGGYGSSGDGGPAVAAQLAAPAALAFGPSSELLFVEAGDSRVRALTTTGDVVAVAGRGGRAESGDGGSSLAARLDGPTGVTADPNGNVLISEGPGERVREVSAAAGVIYTVAGTGAPGGGDGGPAPSSPLHDPEAVAVTPGGSVVVADAANHAVRAFVPPAPGGCAARLPAGQVVAAAAPASPGTPTAGPGYLLAAADGAVAAFGSLGCAGSELGGPLAQPVVAAAATPDGGGYWLASAGGGVFSFGDAGFFGSAAGVRLSAPVVAMAATADGRGYWLVSADGGVFSFGDAGFHGGAPGTPAAPLNRPIVAVVPTPDAGGYWLVAADGGVFTFGDAPFLGSLGGHPLVRPIVGAAAVPGRSGLWMVAADGGVFTFGAAPFAGSAAGAVQRPVVGMAPTSDGGGYWIVTSDGGVFTYGDAPFAGSAA